MYFGAAKDLPGVRELFEQEPPPPPRKTRGELMKDIDADYYGYRDDDDGVLIPLERLEEKKGSCSGHFPSLAFYFALTHLINLQYQASCLFYCDWSSIAFYSYLCFQVILHISCKCL